MYFIKNSIFVSIIIYDFLGGCVFLVGIRHTSPHYRAPNPVSMIFTVLSVMTMSSQGEKFPM